MVVVVVIFSNLTSSHHPPSCVSSETRLGGKLHALLLLTLKIRERKCSSSFYPTRINHTWLQNHTLTTFFLRSSFSAMAAIFSPEGLSANLESDNKTGGIHARLVQYLGCTAKYASNDLFSGAAIDVLFLFFSPGGRTPPEPSGSRLAASASSNQADKTGFRAIMLLWLKVSDSNLRKNNQRFSLCVSSFLDVFRTCILCSVRVPRLPAASGWPEPFPRRTG